MKKKSPIASLNPSKFFKVITGRKKNFKNAPATPLPKVYPVNALAKRLHPAKQNVVITNIVSHGDGSKTFTFAPNTNKGTTELAYFSAGQYICVLLEINGMQAERAYSLCSSPKESLEGKYEITVRKVDDGLVSSYIHNEWKVGDEVTISGPEGHFEYVGLRDAKTVICIAGGSGVTPFLSMAKAIADGDEDFNMILLSGSRNVQRILFRKEFDELAAKTEKIKVVHVLSEEKEDGYEFGLFTKELILKYAPKGPYSVFICGPQKMNEFVQKELADLGLEKKYIRYELFGELHCASSLEDCPNPTAKEVTLTVHIGDETYIAKGSTDDTILQILEKNRIPAPSSCRCGECGFCHSLVISGEYYAPKKTEHRRKSDERFGWIHPCCSFPLTDMELDVPFKK